MVSWGICGTGRRVNGRGIDADALKRLREFVDAHDGRGSMFPLDAQKYRPAWFSSIAILHDPNASGQAAVLELDADQPQGEEEPPLPRSLELSGDPVRHDWLSAFILETTTGRFLLAPSHELYGRPSKCAVPGCEASCQRAARELEASSWQLATNIAQTIPDARIYHTHPGGGQYDCLTIRAPELEVQINRSGSVRLSRRRGTHAELSYLSWQPKLLCGSDPRRMAEELCDAAGMPWPIPRPASRPHTFTYRLISEVLQQQLRGPHYWYATTQFLDSSGPMDDGPMRRPPSAEMLAIPGNRVWLLCRNERAFRWEGEQVVAWLWDGWAWTSNGERRDLYAMYRSGAALPELASLVVGEAQDLRSPDIPALVTAVEQPECEF